MKDNFLYLVRFTRATEVTLRCLNLSPYLETHPGAGTCHLPSGPASMPGAVNCRGCQARSGARPLPSSICSEQHSAKIREAAVKIPRTLQLHAPSSYTGLSPQTRSLAKRPHEEPRPSFANMLLFILQGHRPFITAASTWARTPTPA